MKRWFGTDIAPQARLVYSGLASVTTDCLPTLGSNFWTGESLHNRLERPLAVVTGASAGIGAALARELAGRAYRVLAVARRADRLEALQQETQGSVIPLVEDLLSEGAAERIFARASALGGADMLVNNAGVGSFARFWESPFELAAKQVRLNTLVNVELTHRFLPEMLAKKSGGVMIVTSTGGFYPTPKLAVYGGTKAFLLSFTEALSEELRGTGVHALALCPGATASEFGEVAGMQQVMEKTPLMQPVDVAKAALRAWDRKEVISRARCQQQIHGAGSAVLAARTHAPRDGSPTRLVRLGHFVTTRQRSLPDSRVPSARILVCGSAPGAPAVTSVWGGAEGARAACALRARFSR